MLVGSPLTLFYTLESAFLQNKKTKQKTTNQFCWNAPIAADVETE